MSEKFIKKNLFTYSPLLLLSLNDITKYFTVDTVINGLTSVHKYKALSFLKRIGKEIELLLEEANNLQKYNIKKIHHSKSVPEIHSYTSTTNVNKDNNDNIDHQNEITETKIDIKKLEKLIKQNNYDYLDDYSCHQNQTPQYKSSLNIMKRKIMKNKKRRNFLPKVTTTMSTNNKSVNNKKLTAFSIDSSSSNHKRKSLLETTYEELKNCSISKHKKNAKTILTEWFGIKIINQDVSSKIASNELLNSLSALKGKIEVTNIKKVMTKIYNNKVPIFLAHKLDYTEELDHKLKTLDLNLVKSLIKEKIKSKD